MRVPSWWQQIWRGRSTPQLDYWRWRMIGAHPEYEADWLLLQSARNSVTRQEQIEAMQARWSFDGEPPAPQLLQRLHPREVPSLPSFTRPPGQSIAGGLAIKWPQLHSVVRQLRRGRAPRDARRTLTWFTGVLHPKDAAKEEAKDTTKNKPNPRSRSAGRSALGTVTRKTPRKRCNPL